jgi:hypothetical protein
MSKRQRRVFLTAMATAMALSACTGGDGAGAPGRGRLVILDGDGQVVVVESDGTAAEALTDDAGSGGSANATYFQPVWDPDAGRIAVSRTDADGGTEVVVLDVDGGESTAVATVARAFYLSWSPDGEQVAYLSNGGAADGISLDVIEGEGTERVGTGQPFYFSWNDDGSSMVAHVGLDRLELMAGDSANEFELAAPGPFRAPQWTDAGIVYIRIEGGTLHLTLAPPDGERRDLAELPGGGAFLVSPDGARVAIAAASAGDAVPAVQTQAPLLPGGQLVVLDVATAEWERVTDDPVVGFWWSPRGETLLVLTFVAGDIPMLMWNLWNGDGLRETASFLPEPSFVREMLPFFDQYAQSTSPWAPDGSAFAFPGSIDGEEGIWVVEAADGAAQLVSEGTWVAWSPR